MNGIGVWDFVASCLGGELHAGDCAPVYELALICAFLVLAVTVLAVLLRQRQGAGDHSAERSRP